MKIEEPIYDIAHLAHVELLTPRLEESVRFFVDVMGMTESGREENSAYLRGWDDYEHHSLKLTASEQPGLGHYALRASSPQALQRRVEAVEQSGLGTGWIDGDAGHGPAYCLTDPDGHRIEIYYETVWYQPPEGSRPALKNQASRYPDRGIGLRRIACSSPLPGAGDRPAGKPPPRRGAGPPAFSAGSSPYGTTSAACRSSAPGGRRPAPERPRNSPSPPGSSS